MVTVRCNEPKKPVIMNFSVLYLGTLFLDIDGESMELLIKTDDCHAIGLEDGEVYRFNEDSRVQLCDVDISYTPKYER